eukprot:CAMPEP_0182590016 /NCGR_PEP_ID=MMETSP1324-20130603/70759_1 /TAXON_ID=236786 /ORGANISM="Florenciella sp., Strain RCC1587" /LENGTH=45 /DNA_ID= /DNA_START= /DNA_END= /DNA_ORIENTATION=
MPGMIDCATKRRPAHGKSIKAVANVHRRSPVDAIVCPIAAASAAA